MFFSRRTQFFFAILQIVLADLQFKTRPDLAVPQLNITIPATGTSPGYIFAAPFPGYSDGRFHKPQQSAPYIFTDEGDLVWSGYTYFSIWAANFQWGKLNGDDVLFSFEGDHNPARGHGHGHVTFLDNNYRTLKEVRGGKHKLLDKHEFHLVGNKSAVFDIYQPVVTDLTPYGASYDQQWIIDAIFQEIDLDTDEILFEWSALDWISPNETLFRITEEEVGTGFNSSDAWDFFHINSIDKDSEGNYLISARHTSALYKINGTSGEIIWKLAGLPDISDSSFSSNFNFSYQHHARYLETKGSVQIISIHDNSAYSREDKNGNKIKNSISSAKIIEVNTESWEATLIKEYPAPDNLVVTSQGSVQILPNGNVFVNWGSEGAVTEFLSTGEPIFHAYLDSGSSGRGVQNYRGFKYNWTGIPNEDIAVVSEFSENDGTLVYVSWNGDTRTVFWNFYSLEDEGKKKFLGRTRKTGFESIFEIPGHFESYIVVEAINARGKVLSTSSVSVSQRKLQNVDWPRHESQVLNYFEWKNVQDNLYKVFQK